MTAPHEKRRALSPHEYAVLWRLIVIDGGTSTSYDIAWSLPTTSPHYGRGRAVGTIFRSLRRLDLVDASGDGFWRATERGRELVFPKVIYP